MSEIVQRLWTAVTCNWFAIGFHCWRHGHDWRDSKPSRCVVVRSCAYCGQYRGSGFIGDRKQCAWWRGPS